VAESAKTARMVVRPQPTRGKTARRPVPPAYPAPGPSTPSPPRRRAREPAGHPPRAPRVALQGRPDYPAPGRPQATAGSSGGSGLRRPPQRPATGYPRLPCTQANRRERPKSRLRVSRATLHPSRRRARSRRGVQGKSAYPAPRPTQREAHGLDLRPAASVSSPSLSLPLQPPRRPPARPPPPAPG
jgi:hypothetical protein